MNENYLSYLVATVCPTCDGPATERVYDDGLRVLVCEHAGCPVTTVAVSA